jgi:hypothetical protein
MGNFLLQVLMSLVGVAIGGFVLLTGRRQLWATLGFVALWSTAKILSVLTIQGTAGWDLIDQNAWNLLLIAVCVGVTGILIGRFLPGPAVILIGFATGANTGLWFLELMRYLLVHAQLTDQAARIIGWIVVIACGVGGAYLVRRYRDEALILITMLMGTEMIVISLRLDGNSQITAVISLSLAFLGVVIQYADYLREMKGRLLPSGLEQTQLDLGEQTWLEARGVDPKS